MLYYLSLSVCTSGMEALRGQGFVRLGSYPQHQTSAWRSVSVHLDLSSDSMAGTNKIISGNGINQDPVKM